MSRVWIKRAAVLLLAVLLGAALFGCLEHPSHYSRREVAAYLKEKFPGEDITVSRNYTEEPDKDYDRTVRTWDCQFTDLPDAVFQVSSSWWNGSPIPAAGFSLGDNAQRTLWNYYLEQYLQEVGSLDAWEIEDHELTLSYASMEPVAPAQEQLQAFYDWLAAQPHAPDPLSATCRLTDLPLPAGGLDVWEYIRPEETSWASACGDMTKVCARMMKDYYAFYALPCPAFTPAELASHARFAWPWTPGEYPCPSACSRDGQSVSLSSFAGIGLNAGYISYAGLYEMLSHLSFETEGQPEDFSFTGADGALYQFSYGDALHREGDAGRWYYLRDGEPVESGAAPRLYLFGEALETMTGLDFTL